MKLKIHIKVSKGILWIIQLGNSSILKTKIKNLSLQ